MKIWKTLAMTETSEGGELTLRQRDEDLYLLLDGEELMSTRAPGSEAALAALGCEHVRTMAAPRVLNGGLGLGFTLRAALEILPPGAELVVAELFPAVVEWNRTFLAHLHEGAMEDPRVQIFEGDVWDLLRGKRDFDAILLDIDNGPTAWCVESNGRMYGRKGLDRLFRSLKPGGVLAIWASQPDSRFEIRLRKLGFDVVTREIRTKGQAGNRRHVVILARL